MTPRGRFIGLLGPLTVLATLPERPPPRRGDDILIQGVSTAEPIAHTRGRQLVIDSRGHLRTCKACRRSQFKRCAEHRRLEARARAEA